MNKIYLLNEKGGVGKSTLAFHLSGALAQKGSTILIDADTQESSYRYYSMVEHSIALEMRQYEAELGVHEETGAPAEQAPTKPAEHPSFSALVYPDARSAAQLEKEAQHFDYMVVDTPARIDRPLLKSIMESECLVLIPTDTKLTDLWTTAELVRTFKGSRATLRVVQRQGQQPRAYAREELESVGLFDVTLNTVISTLNAYDDAVREGGTITDIPATPSNRPMLKAKSEINSLTREVDQVLQEITTRPSEVVSG